MADEILDTPVGEEIFDPQAEITTARRALREVSMMIDQSQGELTRLTQRNSAITATLQQSQRKGPVPTDELRTTYEAALDAQQRLFVMRGQLEKLQSDKGHLIRYIDALNRIAPSEVAGDSSTPDPGRAATLTQVESIVKAQEAERQRLSRQMHDGPAQALSNFILQTEIAMRLLEAEPAQAKEELASLKGAAMKTFQKVRNFIFELRPMMLDDLGLVPTIRKYADALKEQTSQEITVIVSGTERRLDSYLEVMVFRAVQELLGNAIRHSQSGSIKVHVDLDAQAAKISVEDDGRGFDPASIQGTASLGLKLIRERAEMLGGAFEVDSAVGKGTRVAISVPL